MARWRCGFVLESGEPCGSFAEASDFCDTHTVMNTMAQWRCGFALGSGQPCGEAATYGGFCDAHTATAVETCLCGAPALGEAALADDMYTAHPTLCVDCAASDNLMACGNCGRLGTEDVITQHNKDAHYTMQPLGGTTASAETVAQCLDSLPSDARPTCTACDHALRSYDGLREHANDNHLKCIRRETGSSERLTQCEVHRYNREGTYRGGFCRLCIRRHPATLQWVCEPCGRVEIGPEGPAHHFAERHGDLQRHSAPKVFWEHTCRVCGDTWVPRVPFMRGSDQWLDGHFIPAHVANLACPLDGCRDLPQSPWADDTLRQHIMDAHTWQALQPIVGYRDSVLLSVRNGFAKARNARQELDTPTTSVRRRMLCSAAWPVEHSRRFSRLNRAFALADYMLALGSPGPLLRELCWGSTRPPTDIDGLEDAVIASFRAVTEPRCIAVDSHKSYANLPTDMWGVIMSQLPYRDALALGQTCRRLWAVYEDVWRGPTDALLQWLRILPTDIHRRGQCDTCGMDDAEDYFALGVLEIVWALGHKSKDNYYPLRGLAHTAIIKYGSVNAFKKAYVEQLAEDFFRDSSGSDSNSDDDDDWEGEEDGETASGEGSNDEGEGVSGSESE